MTEKAIKSIILETKLNRFFCDPKMTMKPPNYYGVLYLLRRDVYRCLGYNTETWNVERERIIWPATMTVLAGVDLLGKFYAGNDDFRGVSKRFQDYVRKYIDSENPEIIYQLRNSLLHSFGLLSKAKNRSYKFRVTAEKKELVEKRADSIYNVDLITLWHKFEESIISYRSDLESDALLKQKFEIIYNEYGELKIG